MPGIPTLPTAEARPKRSVQRKIALTAITLFIFLLIAELLCRAYYYQSLVRAHPIAMIQLKRDLRAAFKRRKNGDSLTRMLQHNQMLIRPQVSQEENNEINREC